MNLPNQSSQTNTQYTHRGRVLRVFGTYLPPKKVYKAKRYLTLRFKITGVVPSKKNDYFAVNNYRLISKNAFKSKDPDKYLRDNIKSWIRGSKKYLEWLEVIDAEINQQRDFWRNKYDLIYPLKFVSVKTYYYFSDKMARDLVNKNESIFDMLVSKKIIGDDSYSTLYKYSSDGNCYPELNDHVTTIDVTVALF